MTECSGGYYSSSLITERWDICTIEDIFVFAIIGSTVLYIDFDPNKLFVSVVDPEVGPYVSLDRIPYMRV